MKNIDMVPVRCPRHLETAESDYFSETNWPCHHAVLEAPPSKNNKASPSITEFAINQNHKHKIFVYFSISKKRKRVALEEILYLMAEGMQGIHVI